jgi:hypothetical protein
VSTIRLIGFHCLCEHICDQPGSAMPGFSIRRHRFDMASGTNPVFSVRSSVRSLGNGTDYVIDVLWADGTMEEETGVFASPDDAARWVNDHRESWMRDRLGMKIH